MVKYTTVESKKSPEFDYRELRAFVRHYQTIDPHVIFSVIQHQWIQFWAGNRGPEMSDIALSYLGDKYDRVAV